MKYYCIRTLFYNIRVLKYLVVYTYLKNMDSIDVLLIIGIIILMCNTVTKLTFDMSLYDSVDGLPEVRDIYVSAPIKKIYN